MDAGMQSTQPPPMMTLDAVAAHSRLIDRIRTTYRADGLEDEPREASGDNALNFDRAMGFGSEGFRKAQALLQAIKSSATRERPLQLPDATWAAASNHGYEQPFHP